MKVLFCVLLLFWIAPLFAANEDASRYMSVKLPEDISELLKKEMNMILNEMKVLSQDVAMGNFESVEKSGRALQNGYIMKQKLTSEQKSILMQRLPKAFKELDYNFHRQAGLMADAAKQHNAELVNFYIFKMNEGCVACHSRFAVERFPGFNPEKGHASGHHH